MIERKIIIGLITSTEFCEMLKPYWDDKLLESATARRISMWIWEYFDKYEKAPMKEIETIFFNKVKEPNFPKDIAEEIEQELFPSLNDEYIGDEFNLEFEFYQASNYLTERHVRLFTEQIQNYLVEGKTEEAEYHLHSFKPLGANVINLTDHIRTVEKIRNIDREKPLLLMKPWLRAGQMTIIYGNFGTGKSLLALLIAYLLGMRIKDSDIEDAKISNWQVKNPCGCLYIDGELGEIEMEERIKGFEWLGIQRYKLHVLSIPEYQMETEDNFQLANRVNQRKVISWLKENPDYKLVVLDSASTLFGLEDENNNSEWNNKVNPFIRDLRALGVASILLHHSGKDRKRGFRGASAIGAMAHNIFRLDIPENKDVDDGEARFILTKDKQRAGGKLFPSFTLHFYQQEQETRWDEVKSKIT